MRTILFIIFLASCNTLMAQTALFNTIVNKIWQLNEFYNEQELVTDNDPLYFVFKSDGTFQSSDSLAEIYPYALNFQQPHEASFTILEPDPNQNPPSPNYRIIITNLIEQLQGVVDDYEYEVTYYDNDDLVLEQTLVIAYDENDTEEFTLEYRFVQVE